jgi:hypothetical protein
VHESPEALSSARSTLETARGLETAFEGHLVLEETVIFPAIRASLPELSRKAILEEIRSRRTPW